MEIKDGLQFGSKFASYHCISQSYGSFKRDLWELYIHGENLINSVIFLLKKNKNMTEAFLYMPLIYTSPIVIPTAQQIETGYWFQNVHMSVHVFVHPFADRTLKLIISFHISSTHFKFGIHMLERHIAWFILHKKKLMFDKLKLFSMFSGTRACLVVILWEHLDGLVQDCSN